MIQVHAKAAFINVNHPLLITCSFYVTYVASTAISICPKSNNAGDDTDNSIVFVILFSLSLVIIILLVAVIIYLIVKLKKSKSYSPQT